MLGEQRTRGRAAEGDGSRIADGPSSDNGPKAAPSQRLRPTAASEKPPFSERQEHIDDDAALGVGLESLALWRSRCASKLGPRREAWPGARGARRPDAAARAPPGGRGYPAVGLATIGGTRYASTVIAATRSPEATLRRSEHRELGLPRVSEPNARGPHGHGPLRPADRPASRVPIPPDRGRRLKAIRDPLRPRPGMAPGSSVLERRRARWQPLATYHPDRSGFNPETSPRVSFDLGHGNFHDIKTTYVPFAMLLKNDGIVLRRHEGLFTENTLQDIGLLIIVNATQIGDTEGETSGAFTESEINVLRNWVQNGGSLLLIADHDPFGSAVAGLAKAFGVGMSSVWTVDTLRFSEVIGKTTWLEFSEENKGLGRHSILQSENPESAVRRAITFTGQSLSFDSTWTSILQLSPYARNYYSRSEAEVAAPDTTTYFPVPGQSQLIAREYENGRIVIAGEAAMFTAQEVRIFFESYHAGFNYNGCDNKNLVLNIVRWLLREIA